ncbi:EAL domain-containing protein [Marinobacterium rhizophilum]|uniref:EAL domain-containing protein n=1 Tax=Marinobacterium rhizophilum TaxID=420402 RepID=A0ABY5HIR1_9GAMM|nr:EAL domain-containing protein [Marinobacterium rhizophilum]UTW12175.1 EAL domain-containing protein [Marinobacterium rhizophilum]
MSETVFPWFQPIIEVASGKVAGFEALARRTGVSGTIESAGDIFRDPARSARERLDVDRSVRYQALQKFSTLAGTQFLSLNLSPEWIDNLRNSEDQPTLSMIRELGLDPSRLVLEITEHNGETEQIQRQANRYRGAGIGIAYDDFGTGFQQLDRLLAFTPDLIKLDLRMFHKGACSAHKEAILQMIGQMGAQLGSKIVCEGVETAEDFYLALQCNASYVQGCAFARAQEGFVVADATRVRVRELLKCHLDTTVEHSIRTQWQEKRLHGSLLALRDLLVTGASDTALGNYHPAPGIQRLYICNREGDQTSPNYSFQDGAWQADSSVIGNNWSWRPYFYQLIGASDYQRRILRSAPYLDIGTGQRCVTLSLALDNNRVLLVDVNAPERLSDHCHSELMPRLNGAA